MTELQFVDELPGRRSGRHSRVGQRADELKANAGKWAPWPSKTGPGAVAKALGKYGPGFEVVTRILDDGTAAVFVRYVSPTATSSGNGRSAEAGDPPPQDRRHVPRSSVRTALCSSTSKPAKRSPRPSCATNAPTPSAAL